MTKRWLMIAAVALPGLVLAGLGLTHPDHINAGTAPWWTTLHIVLVPVFPLLGVVVWLLLRDDRTAVGWAGRIAAATYVVFYTALDAVSGIAAGTAVQAGASADTLAALLAIGGVFGRVGGYAFFVAVILVLGSAVRRGTRAGAFYVAAAILLVCGFSFTTSHIAGARGVLTMIGFAIGFAVVEFTLRGSSTRRSVQP